MKLLNITVEYIFKNNRCVRPQIHTTYDVTRTTFSTSCALHNHANFAEYFENDPSIKHADFSKMIYPEMFR